MKRTIITALLGLICLAGQGQEKTEINPGWLWEISGNGLKQSSYLFGTCHGEGHNFTDEEVFSIYGLREAMAEVEAVYLETTADSTGLPKMKDEDMQKFKELIGKIVKPGPEFMMPEGVYYKPLFDSVAQFNRFNKFMNEKMRDVEYYKKTPAYWCIRMSLYMFSKPRHNVRMVEAVLRETCQASGKEMGGLETLQFVYSKLLPKYMDVTSIDTMDMKKQVELLNRIMEVCDNDTLYAKSELHRAYLTNDTVSFACYMKEKAEQIKGELASVEGAFEAMEKSKEYDQQYLVRDRNIAWLPVIEKQIAPRRVMIAVGCAHLMGSNGLIAMLREKGYSVTPVIER